ncbi:metalloprotease family protein [Priestia megaterium]|uniref:metalloprotease family protein n=1 Tax=Priestia megaterium TaxID=1404 RepID=UPI00159C4BD1|nr:metalloprotease family protein [Priestia megaterium]
MLRVLFYSYALLFLSLLIHEWIHYILIKIFQKEIKSIKINFLGGKISYTNDHEYIKILTIAVAPNIALPFLGGFLFYLDMGMYYNIFALFCVLNLINLFPFTADGSTVLYCILKIIMPKKILKEK